MQLLITLQPQSTPFVIPKDYSYLLSSAIYSLIKQSDKEFAKFLHDAGWRDGYKSFKFYTFGRFHGTKKTQHPNCLLCDSKLTLRFHSLQPDILNNLVLGIFQSNVIKMMGFGNLEIIEVESLPAPMVNDNIPTLCYTRSPIIIHKKTIDNKKWAISPEYSEWSDYLVHNLVEKSKVFYGSPVDTDSNLQVSINHDEWKTKNYGMIRSRIGKEGFTYRGYQLPITLIGSKKLIEFAVNTGIGEMNAMGFGCLEINS